MEARVDWNDENVEKLKTLWGNGSSCSQIARQIAGATRSAVIGKIHRIGLAGRVQPHKEKAVRQRSVAPPKAPPVPVILSAPILAMVLESGAFVTLETVSNRTCRWPIGDPREVEFHFCGNAPKDGKPYCAGHCGQAYTTAAQRVMRDDDGRRSENRRKPIRRGQVSMWE